jgi:integrase
MLHTLQKIEKRGAHEMSRRAMQYCSQIFRYAIVTGRAERNPTADLKGALKPVKHGHFAALDVKDLPEFLQAIESHEVRLFIQTRLAIRLMMLTFVRTGELIKAKWDEFDLDTGEWNIPAERMKMRRPHIVPLSKQAIVVLRELQKLSGNRDYVFASAAKPRQHMSNNTILKALERIGYKGRMTGHGFRALAMSTIKENLGYRHEVVDRQLAHAHANKVDAAYDRAKFLPERRKMMQEWADYLDDVASGGKVIVGKFKKSA